MRWDDIQVTPPGPDTDNRTGSTGIAYTRNWTVVQNGNIKTITITINAVPGSASANSYATEAEFIAYAATPSVTEQMLVNMFIGRPPGNYDRILDFSTAVTGGLFFVPSADFLDDLPAPAAAASAPSVPATPPPPPPSSPPPLSAPDGSLGIGGLKRSSQS